MLLGRLQNAKSSFQTQESSASAGATGSAKKPVSFLRSLWNVFVDDDDQLLCGQLGQGSDPAKCVDLINKTQQHLREFFQLTVCNFLNGKAMVCFN